MIGFLLSRQLGFWKVGRGGLLPLVLRLDFPTSTFPPRPRAVARWQVAPADCYLPVSEVATLADHPIAGERWPPGWRGMACHPGGR